MDWSIIKDKSKATLSKTSAALVNAKSSLGESSVVISSAVRDWLISTLIKTIETISTEQDRLEVLSWLALVREVLNNNELAKKNKIKEIYAISDTKKTVGIVLRGVSATVNNYKNSDLPLAVKIAIPTTLAAAAVIGGQGAGIVAFGTGIGLPVLLLVFLGAAGITAVLEAFVSSKDARSYVGVVMTLIVRDEMYRRAQKNLQDAMVASPASPKHYDMPTEESELRQKLLTMDPFEFEQHVMSFFQHAGMLAWVTKKSNDAGVDGFAKHEQGLIVVQCKRFAEHNTVGRPVVQQFKGVIEENQAWRGYVVTTSSFTHEAKDSAGLNDRLVLVGMDELVVWHSNGLKG